MKALLVSLYAQPDLRFSNTNVYRQASSLKADHGVDVEILTWEFDHQGKGSIAKKATRCTVPPIRSELGGLIYHLINPPNEWSELTLKPSTWEDAVAFGVGVLEALRPDVVHLHHWRGLWWILESAQRLGIRTVYSNHDWGLACLRTILVMGDGALCDGRLWADKCTRCIWKGRSVVGKLNEVVAETAIGRSLIDAVYWSPLGHVFEQRGAVRLPLRKRVESSLDRAQRILSKLDAMFTPSEFGRRFFSQLGTPLDRIRVKPWYYDPIRTGKVIEPSQPFTIAYVGRVSPEKGVHLIFEALERVRSPEPIRLMVAGANTSEYCVGLRRKYPGQVGLHAVEWLGWSEIEPLFRSTDVSIIPSTGIDNTPLALVEAISYRIPVIATRVPPIEELVVAGENGYLADYGSVESLASAIESAVADKDRIRSGAISFPMVSSCREYTLAVKDAYVG